MKFFCFLLLVATFAAQAAERYAPDAGPASALAAFSRAVHQEAVRPSGGDALRVWTRDYMMGQVQGYLVSEDGALSCRMASTYKDGIVTVGRAKCRPFPKGAAVLEASRSLPSFSRSEWDCPLMDGGEVYIEGVHGGRYFAVRVGNPDACDDPESQAITALLSKLS